jgi:hypothetical protein
MIKEPYYTKILHDYPAFEWVDVELEDGSGFQDTMDMIQEAKIALFIVDQPYYGPVTGNYIMRHWSVNDIKANQGVREWYLWKFVLPSEGYPPIEIPYSTRWHDTSYADRVWMYPITSRPRTMWQIRRLELPSRDSITNVLIRQYVYGPMPKGFWCFDASQKYWPILGPCTGFVRNLARGRIVSTLGAVYSYGTYRIVSPDGIVRQEQGYVTPWGWPHRWGVIHFSLTGGATMVSKSFGTEEGDYLVFEIGVQQTKSPVIIEIEFGDFADDFLQYHTDPEPRSLNPFLTVWSAPDLYHTGEGQCDFWLPRRRPCRFVSIDEPVDWPEPSSQGNAAGLNEVAFGESV